MADRGWTESALRRIRSSRMESPCVIARIVRHLVIGLMLLGVLAAGIVYVRRYVGPRMIRDGLRKALSPYWKGDIRIDDPIFSFSGPYRVGSITLFDQHNRPSIQARAVELALNDRPWMESRPPRIRIRDLHAFWRLDPNEPGWPLQTHPVSQTGWGPWLDRLQVENCSVDLVGSRGSQISYRGMAWQMNCVGEQIRILLTRRLADRKDYLFAEARIDPASWQTQFKVDLSHTVNPDEVRLVWPFFKASEGYSAQGRIRASVRVEVADSPFTDSRIDGAIELEEFDIWDSQGNFIADRVSASVELADDFISVPSLSGRFCQAPFQATMMGNRSGLGMANMTGQVIIRAVSLETAGRYLPIPGHISGGTADLEYVFYAPHTSGDLYGYGLLDVSQADLISFPVIPDLFSCLGLPGGGWFDLSDASLLFSHSGPWLQIQQARVSNAVAALIAESGGTIHLRDGMLDLYVIAAPIKQMDDFLRWVPGLRLFNQLKDKLVRLHVFGHWSLPAQNLIQKQPIQDIGEGLAELLEELARSGGTITESIRQTSRTWMDELFGGEKGAK